MVKFIMKQNKNFLASIYERIYSLSWLENKTTKNSLSTDITTRYGYKTIFIVSGCCKCNMMTVFIILIFIKGIIIYKNLF
ncbi:hypothetical protein KsCSTR_25980 [Candidatus Kuenenia stuttgartiensis]|uniref:Uncharacterized protein n=1 Tax=Kuenenia stuttgartiensis TaxID=174633 RepID=Q1Q761_KUEST|nr:hypothetical protein KsCSTR_25980 [Candidatus Kuenenia stuttgartiensis]CAJ73408.1 unknown protein [Candidatus Kuenenia stuttgartiensis]SOH06463.1 hypothetical protein KSMBR1_3991 [Candidatus Kuenenia stuttgartiensis]